MAVRDINAIKKSLLEGGGSSFEELFSLQSALETGASDKFAGKVGTWTQGKESGSLYENFDSSNLGSILKGGTEAIAALKKRKLEQQTLGKQGVGQTQTILGGSVI